MGIYEARINGRPELAEDVDFMMKAVNEQTSNIKFDKTNNEKLYMHYVELKIEELNKLKIAEPNEADYNFALKISSAKKSLEAIKEELLNPKKIPEGKYKIPHKYLFEIIRDDENYQYKYQEHVPIYNTSIYFDYDGKHSVKFGKEMESLYDDPTFFLGLHGSYITISDEIVTVLHEGLRATAQGEGYGHLASHVMYGEKLRFVCALIYYRNNPNNAETIFILRIPRSVFSESNPTPLYGSQFSEINGEAHILPKYMYGYINRKSLRECDSQIGPAIEKEIIKKKDFASDESYPYTFLEKTMCKSKESPPPGMDLD